MKGILHGYKIHIFKPPCNVLNFYYIDTGVLPENIPKLRHR